VSHFAGTLSKTITFFPASDRRSAAFNRLLKNSFSAACGTVEESTAVFQTRRVFEKRSKVKITLFALPAEQIQGWTVSASC
jgi:hypothetical protein